MSQHYKVTKRTETVEVFYVLEDSENQAKMEVQYGRVADMDRISHKREIDIEVEEWQDSYYNDYTVIGLRDNKIKTYRIKAPNKEWAAHEAEYADGGGWKLIEVLEGIIEES